jgi:CHAT domain-containing protein/tetratricopeptide (TPR) repeat protein
MSTKPQISLSLGALVIGFLSVALVGWCVSSSAQTVGNSAASSLNEPQSPAADKTEAALLAEIKNLEAQKSGSPEIAEDLDFLAEHYEQRGRNAEADQAWRRSLAIKEKIYRPGDPKLTYAVFRIAHSYLQEGRLKEALPLLERVVSECQRELGTDSPTLIDPLSNILEIYKQEGKRQDALRIAEQEVAIANASARDGYTEAYAFYNLAEVYSDEGRFQEAEPLLVRARTIASKWPTKRYYGEFTSELAGLKCKEGRYAEAEPLFREAGALLEHNLGSNHLLNERNQVELVLDLAAEGKVAEARRLFGAEWRTFQRTARSYVQLGPESERYLRKNSDEFIRRYLEILATVADHPEMDPSGAPVAAEAFSIAEAAHGDKTELALIRAAVRAAARDPAARDAADKVQRLSEQQIAMASQIGAQYQSGSSESQREVGSVLAQSESLDRELVAANDELGRVFPGYEELAAPELIDADGVERVLRPDEALISYFTLDDRLLMWCVRAGKPLGFRDPKMDSKQLAATVARVRQSLAPDKPFDVADSAALYRTLVGPFSDQLAGVKSLIVVPDDVLLPIPFAALITDDRGPVFSKLADDYRHGVAPLPTELATDYPKVSWLAKSSLAITILPTATSLRLLKSVRSARLQNALAPAKTEPFIGIGDPLLHGTGTERGDSMVATRGAAAVETLRNLPPLPGARDELMAEARALSANPADALFIQERATKPEVVALSKDRLRQVRVISFATHALVGGEVMGVMEPALVLTPPAQSTDDDNGLLTMDDIMGFKLNANDWTILSACDTAAADGSGEGLSGLTRAFFFAGGTSLLVSQWSVDDAATRQLMTNTLSAFASNPKISRAQALATGMRAMMTEDAKGEHAYFAHPFAWAPFMVVGEGGAAN